MTFCDFAEEHDCDSFETVELRRYLLYLRWLRMMAIYF
jgi:hypothetical protein